MARLLVPKLIVAAVMCGLSFVDTVSADQTCTAPGHSSCTITCPDGCGALYVEPNGPCRTFCSGRADMPSDAVSFGGAGMTLEELQQLLANPQSTMEEMK